MPGASDAGKAGAIAANAHILERALRLEAPGEPLPCDFKCECGRAECTETVPLSISEYEAVRELRADVLAAGHSRSPVQKAHELVEESKALRAQAEQQTRRAARILGIGLPKFGQTIWVHDREAVYLYPVDERCAAIRYSGEPEARVVPYRKISLQPGQEPDTR